MRRHLTTLVALVAGIACAVALVSSAERPPADPLPSWNDGATKRAILDFVGRVTAKGSPDFVAPAERIATFDNDGTLWCEQPMYVQLAFAIDRVRELAPAHPEWKEREPFASILAGDVRKALAGGESSIAALIGATHAGITTEEFDHIVRSWIATAKHPTRHCLYTDLVYQPMLELLAYLRDSGFRTFIVSGGGADFMRPWTERTYGIPPEQVVGSRGRLKWEATGGPDGTPALLKLAEIDLVDDGPGKPVGIHQLIGRRPVMAFGNSDGDLQMLEWTTGAPGARFGLIVHHTDAEREYAYDRDSHIGRLDKALDAAKSHGWTVVDMRNDWATIFPKPK